MTSTYWLGYYIVSENCLIKNDWGQNMNMEENLTLKENNNIPISSKLFGLSFFT